MGRDFLRPDGTGETVPPTDGTLHSQFRPEPNKFPHMGTASRPRNCFSMPEAADGNGDTVMTLAVRPRDPVVAMAPVDAWIDRSQRTLKAEQQARKVSAEHGSARVQPTECSNRVVDPGRNGHPASIDDTVGYLDIWTIGYCELHNQLVCTIFRTGRRGGQRDERLS